MPVLEESRETMFKCASRRYVDILDSEFEFSELEYTPILVLKNRRKGESQKTKTARDILDLLIFASGLSDIFPKDTLSSNTSKFIELGGNEKNSPEKDDIITGSALTDDTVVSIQTLDVAGLANRMRDQDAQIVCLKEEVVRTRTELLSKIETIHQLLQCVSKAQSMPTDSSSVLSQGRAHLSTEPTLNDLRENEQSELCVDITTQSSVPSNAMVVPPYGSLTQREGNILSVQNDSRDVAVEPQPIASITVEHTNRHGHTSTNVPTPEVLSSSNISSSSSNGVHIPTKMQYSEAASLPGQWLQQRTKKRPRYYRDEPDRYPGGNVSNIKDGVGQSKHALKGASREKLTMMYVQNIEISDDDNEDTIISNIRQHCLAKGVKIVRAYVIYNRYNDYIVGCKLSVVVSQKHPLTADDFWPCNIRCREWQKGGNYGDRNNNRITSFDNDTNTLSRTMPNNHVSKSDVLPAGVHSWGSQREIEVYEQTEC